MFLNGSAMDVMYYTSPLYRTEVSSINLYIFVFTSYNHSSFQVFCSIISSAKEVMFSLVSDHTNICPPVDM